MTKLEWHKPSIKKVSVKSATQGFGGRGRDCAGQAGPACSS